MQIDWYWIKQRPQIIAELLSEKYDVTVLYYKEVFAKQSLRKDKDELKKCIPVPAVPFRDKNIWAYRIQKRLFRKNLKKIQEYDTVWITHPLLYRYIPENYQGQIIYDCMDNHEALCKDARIRKRIRTEEKKLIERSDQIFASSTGLMKKISRAGGEEKAHLIRNGFMLREIHAPQPRTGAQKKKYKIGYFGTIAEWFDFPLLLRSLEKHPELEYHLWGPISNRKPPEHPRLILEGVAEHRCLWEKVKDMDGLIMPFVMNDMIRDVDPVKLYEYISMGKAILSVYYKEVEKFREFVYFYNTQEEFDKAIEALEENHFLPGYDEDRQKDFLRKNTWKNRVSKIENELKDGKEKQDHSCGMNL